MDPETANQPLIRARTASNVPENNGRSSRGFKVAGIVLFASVLIVGQAMITYLLLSQRNDMKSLEEKNKDLQSEMKKGSSGGSVPIRMPVNFFPEMMSVSMDMDADTRSKAKTGAAAPIHMPLKTILEPMSIPEDMEVDTSSKQTHAPPKATDCQLEAAADKSTGPSGFWPACDELGFYRAEQCYMKSCWCVNTTTGAVIPGSESDGHATCSTAVTPVMYD